MKTLQDFYNEMNTSSESMEADELGELELLELSAEAISQSAREIEKGIDLVLSLESMVESLNSDLSLESESDFIESLESLLSHSGLDIPVDFFVSFEAEEVEQNKVSEAIKEGSNDLPKDKKDDKDEKDKTDKKRKINVKDTKEKIIKGAEKIKEWILEKTKEFSKWLETRIKTLEDTSEKLLTRSEANGKILASINTRGQGKSTDDQEE